MIHRNKSDALKWHILFIHFIAYLHNVSYIPGTILNTLQILIHNPYINTVKQVLSLTPFYRLDREVK